MGIVRTWSSPRYVRSSTFSGDRASGARTLVVEPDALERRRLRFFGRSDRQLDAVDVDLLVVVAEQGRDRRRDVCRRVDGRLSPEKTLSKVTASWPVTFAVPLTRNVAVSVLPLVGAERARDGRGRHQRREHLIVGQLEMERALRCAVRQSSVSVTGIVFGPGPSLPAMATARSCRNAPMISPVVETFIDDARLGSTV